MKKNMKLVRRIALLAILMGCLGFLVFSDYNREVLAAPCCSSCDPDYDDCIYSGNPASYCRNVRNSCYRNCVECGGGGNCGASCTYDYECGGGYGCEFCIQGSCQ